MTATYNSSFEIQTLVSYALTISRLELWALSSFFSHFDRVYETTINLKQTVQSVTVISVTWPCWMNSFLGRSVVGWKVHRRGGLLWQYAIRYCRKSLHHRDLSGLYSEPTSCIYTHQNEMQTHWAKFFSSYCVESTFECREEGISPDVLLNITFAVFRETQCLPKHWRVFPFH